MELRQTVGIGKRGLGVHASRLMPACAFEIRWNKGKNTSWTYFPTDGHARDFARILIQNFKSGAARLVRLRPA